jgi:hypothetical protein
MFKACIVITTAHLPCLVQLAVHLLVVPACQLHAAFAAVDCAQAAADFNLQQQQSLDRHKACAVQVPRQQWQRATMNWREVLALAQLSSSVHCQHQMLGPLDHKDHEVCIHKQNLYVDTDFMILLIQWLYHQIAWLPHKLSCRGPSVRRHKCTSTQSGDIT